MPQNESRFMAPLVLAGRLIMENGGETYRVEETITRMGRAFGLSGVESFAIPSGVFVSYLREDGSHETAVIRVRKGSTNLSRVDAVNRISRQVEQGLMDCEEAHQQLKAVESTPAPFQRLLPWVTALSSGGFALMFGGGAIEFIVSAVASGAMQLMALFFQRRRLHGLVSVLAGSVVCSLIPMLFNRLTGLCMVDAAVAGALMPMLPGLAMTNAVQDAMRGDIVSGVSHGFSALLTAVMVAGGALVASALMRLVTGGGLP